MRVILYEAHCVHLHRLFHHQYILHISVECVKVRVSAHQVLSLTGYIFEASYSTSGPTYAILNLWAGIGTLTYSVGISHQTSILHLQKSPINVGDFLGTDAGDYK